jgi:hypothetical protein
MNIFILGGGFLGQLLHTIWPRARVFDARPEMPIIATRSLGPQYLWKPLPHLRCQKFKVYTFVDGELATPESILQYKQKVGKEQDESDWRSQFQAVMDGYDVDLPFNRVEYARRVVRIDRASHQMLMDDGNVWTYDLLITTIPLDVMLRLTGLHRDEHALQSRPIYMVVGQAVYDPDMNVNYISDSMTPVYRQTLRKGQIFTESLHPMPDAFRIAPGKIYRHAHVHDWLNNLQHSGIYSFGRFARWEPDELAHETYANALDLSQTL